ncbi:hypothetical protein BB560_005112 [Smittium megazygosporum]|uniref:Uncharacterized protein n=1 Tax=Smittium megazygosporum TaxID=133381 RepID=A0A2T9Z7D4_9FUNG|nr:hypothetical protein BB560_005112 [Smittium megazygosporum]
MDTPSDNSEPPPEGYKPGSCWDKDPAKSAYAHYKAYGDKVYCLHEECRAVKSLNRDQFGKKPKTIARFKCRVCKQNVYIKEYMREYMGKALNLEKNTGSQEIESSQESVSISQTQDNNTTNINKFFNIEDSDEGSSSKDFLSARVKLGPKKAQKLPFIFGLKNQEISLSRERVIPAKRPAITINDVPTRMRYVTEDSLQEHLSRHLESVKKVIGKTANTDNERKEVRQLKEENESLKREIKILKERMGKDQPNTWSKKQQKTKYHSQSASEAQKPTQISQEPPQKPTFAEIARKLAKGKPEAENFRVQEALRNLAGAKPLTSGTKAELRHGYSRIFIKGIVRQKYSDVKILFKELGFKVNRLINLEFIGQKILEVTVPGYYAASFIRKIKELEIFEILPKVDPSKPMNPESSPETAGKIKKAYENRLNKAIQTTKWENFAEYLFDLAAESGINLGKRLFPNNPEEINLNESSDEEKIVNKRRKNRIITTPPSIDQSSQNNNDLHTDQYDNKIHTTDLSDEIIPETILIMGSSPISQIDSETERQIWDNICRSDD